MARPTAGLDELGRKIVRCLQTNARASNSSIARELGVSEATVRKRIDRLMHARLIDFVVAVDPVPFSYGRIAIIGVQVDIDKAAGAAEALSRLDPVNFLAYTSGTYDFMLIGQFHSDEELIEFLTQKLARIPGVRRTETALILKVAKRSALWGLPGPASGAVEPWRLLSPAVSSSPRG